MPDWGTMLRSPMAQQAFAGLASKLLSGGGIQGALGFAGGDLGAGGPPRKGRRGKPGTQTGMIAMPARLPNKRQFQKVNKRLHDWRAIALSIVNRTGGMRTRRQFRGYRPQRRQQRRRN